MEDIKTTLKKQIIEELNLKGMTANEIENSAPLFGDGLGLDSIDALELIVIMENKHGVKLKDPTQGKEILYSIDSMADYIEKNKVK
jgi:acyl carrier protein